MLLTIENVFGGYGNGDVLKGISCNADYGDVLCLLGPKGCGKTTLFRMMLGTLPVTDGKIKIILSPMIIGMTLHTKEFIVVLY